MTATARAYRLTITLNISYQNWHHPAEMNFEYRQPFALVLGSNQYSWFMKQEHMALKLSWKDALKRMDNMQGLIMWVKQSQQ